MPLFALRCARSVFQPIALWLILLGVSASTFADSLPEITPIPEQELQLTENARDLSVESYLDGLVSGLQRRDQLAGITVGIARKSTIVLQKAYGMAQTKIDAKADQHLFRIGSTSKLMTYLAAMQLVEKNQLKLDQPINSILPPELQIPDQGFSTAITVRDLLHHTAGFEDLALGHLFVQKPEQVLALGEYLKRYRPNRVREAGTAAVYSNYSVALLGEIVAIVSKLSFEEYVQQMVFNPLKMSSSSFREPKRSKPLEIEPALQSRLAAGFVRRAGQFEAQAFEYIGQVAPAGGMSSSASDMLRFGQMMLNGGELDGQRVIQSDTLQSMRAGCFQNGSGRAGLVDELGVQPICHGYMTRRIGAYQAYGHGGATLFFHTAFLTIAEADLAIFVSINTNTGRKSAGDIAELLVQYLHQDAAHREALKPTITTDATEAKQLSGTYLSNRRPFTGFTALVQSLEPLKVAAARDQAPAGAIQLSSGEETQLLLPIAKWTYQNPETAAIVRFISNEGNKVTGFASAPGHTTASKVSGLSHPATWIYFSIALAVVSLLTLFSAYASRHSESRPHLGTVKVISLLSAFTGLVTIGCFAIAVSHLSGPSALYQYPNAATQGFAYAALILTALALVKLACIPAVIRSEWRALAKAGFVLSALVFAGWCMVSGYWGLLTPTVSEIRF